MITRSLVTMLLGARSEPRSLIERGHADSVEAAGPGESRTETSASSGRPASDNGAAGEVQSGR